MKQFTTKQALEGYKNPKSEKRNNFFHLLHFYKQALIKWSHKIRKGKQRETHIRKQLIKQK